MSIIYKRRYNNEKGYYEHSFEHYIVKEESDKFFGIYFNDYGHETLVTSKPNLKQALKTVKLMEQAYKLGYQAADERFTDGRYRDYRL